MTGLDAILLDVERTRLVRVLDRRAANLAWWTTVKPLCCLLAWVFFAPFEWFGTLGSEPAEGRRA